MVRLVILVCLINVSILFAEKIKIPVKGDALVSYREKQTIAKKDNNPNTWNYEYFANSDSSMLSIRYHKWRES